MMNHTKHTHTVLAKYNALKRSRGGTKLPLCFKGMTTAYILTYLHLSFLTFSCLMIYIYIYIYIYVCRSAPLTSRSCILYIYSTNTRTEYFKHAAHSPFFFSLKCRLFPNATFFGSCIIHILNTSCAKI